MQKGETCQDKEFIDLTISGNSYEQKESKEFPINTTDTTIPKTTENKIKINLSPSSLNVYYQSPLLFYLKYIAKVPDDTEVPQCYGFSGSIVHDALEKYAKRELTQEDAYEFFAQQWHKYNLTDLADINGQPLDPTTYLKALINGFKVVDNHHSHVTEEIISFPLIETDTHKIGIKGIVDLQAIHKDDNEHKPVIIDYKTSNSVNQGKEFERQALFYTLLIHKQKNIIPHKSTFYYLKLNEEKTYTFDHTDLQAFEEELQAIAKQLIEYGKDISKYPIGKIDDLFNSKRKACEREALRRSLIQKDKLSAYF